jgi:hypothetical protein
MRVFVCLFAVLIKTQEPKLGHPPSGADKGMFQAQSKQTLPARLGEGTATKPCNEKLQFRRCKTLLRITGVMMEVLSQGLAQQ